MGFLNTKATKKLSPASQPHKNFMAGTSYDVTDAVARLRMIAASCFFGEPAYYLDAKAPRKVYSPSSDDRQRRLDLSAAEKAHLRSTLTSTSSASWAGLSPAHAMEKAIDEALDSDPEATLHTAALLRNEDNIRTTPQVILVRAAMHPALRGTGLVTTWAPNIITRADEPAVCVAYFLSKYGTKTPMPTCLRKALRKALCSFNEYSLAKYRMEKREVKTVDVVNLVRPKPTPAIAKLVKNELKLTGDNRTWESIRSSGGSWEEAIDVMGHMALLRNLRNLAKAGAPRDMFLGKLVATAATGRQLPFRYYSAWKALEKAGVSDAKIQDAVEEAMFASIGALPKFPGRTMSLCDNSGSAQGTTTSKMGSMRIAEIANLSAVLTGKVAEEGYVGVFGDKLETFPIRSRSSAFDDLATCEKHAREIGQSTEHGIWLFWDRAIKERQHWDRVFVYSDMQAGHGGLYGYKNTYHNYVWPRRSSEDRIDVPKLINEYRRTVNPNVNVYLVQVAGYQDTIIPEFYDKTFILGGWSDGVLKFAAAMEGLSKGEKTEDEDEEEFDGRNAA